MDSLTEDDIRTLITHQADLLVCRVGTGCYRKLTKAQVLDIIARLGIFAEELPSE
jgi:hypothetical protein